MSVATTRLKRLLSSWGWLIALVLAVSSVAAFAGAWTVYTSPQIETVTEQRNQQSFTSEVSTSAIVTGNTTLYTPGSRLVDMPVYLTGATPNVTLRVQTSTPEDRPTRVQHQLTLVFEATREGEPFFTRERPVVNLTQQTRNGTVSAAGTVNMSSVATEVAGIREEIGTVGTFQIRLQLRTAYRTNAYEGELTASTPIQLTEGSFWLSQPLADSASQSRTVTREIRQPVNLTLVGGLVGVGVLLLLGAGGMGVLWRRIEVEVAETELAHSQFEDWISSGEFPTGTDKKYISINTLEDLVDIAIDSNKRVVFDTSLEVYAVVDGDLVYYYSADPFSIDAWLDT